MEWTRLKSSTWPASLIALATQKTLGFASFVRGKGACSIPGLKEATVGVQDCIQELPHEMSHSPILASRIDAGHNRGMGSALREDRTARTMRKVRGRRRDRQSTNFSLLDYPAEWTDKYYIRVRSE